MRQHDVANAKVIFVKGMQDRFKSLRMTSHESSITDFDGTPVSQTECVALMIRKLRDKP